MERRIPLSPLLSSHNLPDVFRRGSVFAGLVALGTMWGCAAPEEGDDSADVEIRSDEIVAVTQPREFKNLSAITSPAGATGDPAFCTPNGAHSKITFTRDTTGFMQGQSDVVGIQGSWGKYGGSGSLRKFGGRPACGFLAGSSSPYPFIILGKGSTAPDGSVDRRLYWSRGNWTVSGSAPPPASATQWAAISSTQYATNGNPAVGTRDGQLVVVYLRDNGQLSGNYWTGSTFSTTLNHPNLPTGWTGLGTPTIAFAEGWSQKFSIFVRARNSSNQIRLYETFFQNDHFTSAAGGPTGVWQQVTLPSGAPSMQSDPAYEFDNYDIFYTGTLYYRNGSTIYQVSASNNVDQFNNSTIKAITVGGTTPSISGNPVVIGGVPYEAGRHWVLARGGSNIYWGESFNDEDLAPN